MWSQELGGEECKVPLHSPCKALTMWGLRMWRPGEQVPEHGVLEHVVQKNRVLECGFLEHGVQEPGQGGVLQKVSLTCSHCGRLGAGGEVGLHILKVVVPCEFWLASGSLCGFGMVSEGSLDVGMTVLLAALLTLSRCHGLWVRAAAPHDVLQSIGHKAYAQYLLFLISSHITVSLKLIVNTTGKVITELGWKNILES